MGQKQSPPLEITDFKYDIVVHFFEKRFQAVLTQLFQSINDQLNTLDSSKLNNGANIFQSIFLQQVMRFQTLIEACQTPTRNWLQRFKI